MTHLTPEALAGYLDHDLSRDERQQVELHLASCVECRAELAQVRGLELRRRRRRWIPVLAPLAAAAAVVLAIVLPGREAAPSDLRSVPAGDSPLGIVAPAASAEVNLESPVFVWRSAGPAASYTFTLQEDDGRVVWTSTMTDTSAAVPDSVQLTPGRTWFWLVDALLPDGRSMSTGVQRVRTPP
jgi:hypothetical protein